MTVLRILAAMALSAGCVSDSNVASSEPTLPMSGDEDVADGIDHLAIIDAMIEEAGIDLSTGTNYTGAGTLTNAGYDNSPAGSYVFLSLGTRADHGGAILQLFDSEPGVGCVAGTVMDTALADRIRLSQPGFKSTALGTRSDMMDDARLISATFDTSVRWVGSLVIDRWDDQRIDLLLVDGESCDFPETSCVPEEGRIVFISPDRPTDPNNVPNLDDLPPFYSDAATGDTICNL